mmetsp:Transcript_6244/g.18273  ORF Transcript_6244/g.18273 Transcript_6244/m.18273 type:complete len:208 (-) Transcript_6244:1865-2488(-)
MLPVGSPQRRRTASATTKTASPRRGTAGPRAGPSWSPRATTRVPWHSKSRNTNPLARTWRKCAPSMTSAAVTRSGPKWVCALARWRMSLVGSPRRRRTASATTKTVSPRRGTTGPRAGPSWSSLATTRVPRRFPSLCRRPAAGIQPSPSPATSSLSGACPAPTRSFSKATLTGTATEASLMSGRAGSTTRAAPSCTTRAPPWWWLRP